MLNPIKNTTRSNYFCLFTLFLTKGVNDKVQMSINLPFRPATDEETFISQEKQNQLVLWFILIDPFVLLFLDCNVFLSPPPPQHLVAEIIMQISILFSVDGCWSG